MTMMKKLILAFVVLGLLALLIFRIASEPTYLGLTNDEIAARVRRGMNQEEVRTALGEPTWINEDPDKQEVDWTYFNSRKTYANKNRPLKLTVIFERGNVSKYWLNVK